MNLRSPLPSTTFGLTFEYPYGFTILDELHNFFPELLYDTAIFNNRMMAWARLRVQTLFGESYNRQQHMYRMYQQQARQAAYREWERTQPASPVHVSAMSEAPIRVFPHMTQGNTQAQTQTQTQAQSATQVHMEEILPILTTILGAGAASANPTTPPRQTAVPSSPPPIHHAGQRRVPTRTNAWDAILMNPPYLLQFLTGTTTLGDIDIEFHELGPGGAWQDVQVSPTQAQLDGGSVLISHSAISNDTNCTICQEHELSSTNESPTTSWRQLHCTHVFHQACIDTWFQQHVHCPVCRADIRTIGTTASSTPSTPSSAPSTT